MTLSCELLHIAVCEHICIPDYEADDVTTTEVNKRLGNVLKNVKTLYQRRVLGIKWVYPLYGSSVT